MAKKFPSTGTNVKPTSGKVIQPVNPDPAHPAQQLPIQPPGGPYYKQPGANG